MRLVIDIESNTKHNHIWVAVTRNIDTGEVRTWKAAENLWGYIADATLIVGQNIISFDSVLLNKYWGTKITLRQMKDTLILSRLLDPSKDGGHSLEAWGQRLGKPKFSYRKVWLWMKGLNDKDTPDGAEFDDPIPALMEHYCIIDTEVTADLFLHLEKELKDKEFGGECVELEHKVAAIIAQQVRNGFRLDTAYATGLLTEIKGRLAEIYESMQQRWPSYQLERFSEKTGKRLKDATVTFNPASRQQIGQKLIELGWKPKKFTETGQPMVDEEVLEGLHYPEAKMIAEYLMLGKRVSQIESWLEAVEDDGRVHGKVITNGAVTGRCTHSSPNMAQIPNSGSVYGVECRTCWTASEGKVLLGCDASGLELRMLAHYMKDEEYIKSVVYGSSKEGTDIHTKNQLAAGLPTRDAAKTMIYAFLYGAGPAKIGSIVEGVGHVSVRGQKIINKFLKATPSLSKLRDRVSHYAAKGWVPGLDGRKIWVRSEHSALNSLLQGAGAVVMKKALVLFYGKVQRNGWPVTLVANVHDEVQLETTKEYADTVGQAFVDSIREAGEHFKLRCPLTGEYKYGANWGQTH
jgi:DNA polymerase I-like protein with 3'-5' exonuclease and polymerase domains